MGKIRNMHIKTPTIWQCNITQGCFLDLKRPLFDLCITGFVKKFFNRILEKWAFRQSYLPLKCAFSVHFNEIVTQWTILSVFLDSDGENSQITLKNDGFFYTIFHWLPDSYRDWHLNVFYPRVTRFLDHALSVRLKLSKNKSYFFPLI